MSYDVMIMADTGADELVEVAWRNYTSNVAGMWARALNGMSLNEFDRAPCSEAVGPLADAVMRMRADPETYRAMNPPNGWGNYQGALEFLEWVAGMCAAHTRCTIRISS